jgi:uncharacterized protein (UPF0335 family)
VDSSVVNSSHLRSFVERIEHLEEEQRTINDDKKEVYSEAKGTGFDTKIIKRIVALRRLDKSKRDEEAELLDLYMTALGMVD